MILQPKRQLSPWECKASSSKILRKLRKLYMKYLMNVLRMALKSGFSKLFFIKQSLMLSELRITLDLAVFHTWYLMFYMVVIL